MPRQPARSTRLYGDPAATPAQRRDYEPSVRARTSPGGELTERRFKPRQSSGLTRESYSLFTSYNTIAAAETGRQNLVAKNTRAHIRIVRIEFFLTTADLELVEIYWGDATTYASSPSSTQLFLIPVNSAYSRFTATYAVGSGPIGLKNENLSIRRQTGTTGQTLHYTAWYTRDKQP